MTEDTHRQSTSDSIAMRGKTRSKPRVILELAVTYAMILTVCWTPRPWQRLLWWVAAASVVLFTSISFEGLQAMGVRKTNFLRSLWVVGAALLLATAVHSRCGWVAGFMRLACQSKFAIATGNRA